jgi:hypothetical protein
VIIVRVIPVKVYKFDELSEEAQQTAISNLSDINVDFDWWDYDEGLLDLSQKEMDEAEIKPGEIKSLLFSYKIGAFDIDRGQFLQLKDVVVNNEEAFRKFLKIPKTLWEQCAYYFNNPSRGRNTFLEIQTDDYVEDLTDEESDAIDRAVEIMSSKIHEAWVSLRNNYEHLTSEEAIKDTIKANAYEFYENGKML